MLEALGYEMISQVEIKNIYFHAELFLICATFRPQKMIHIKQSERGKALFNW